MAKEYIRETKIFGNVKNFGGILMYEDGENGMQWAVSGNVANPKCIICDDVALSGGGSLRLYNNNESAVDGKYITIKKPFNITESQIISVEAIFRFKNVDKYKEFVINIYLNDESKIYKAAFKSIRLSSKFQYLNSGETYTDLLAAGGLFYLGTWQYLKFGFNKTTGKYTDFQINKRTFDMSGITVFSDTGYAGTNCYIEITPSQYSNVTNFDCYIDSVLIRGD